MVLKSRTAFLKSIRFYGHPYQAIVIIMAEMVIMTKMAIIAILDIIAIIAIVAIITKINIILMGVYRSVWTSGKQSCTSKPSKIFFSNTKREKTD